MRYMFCMITIHINDAIASDLGAGIYAKYSNHSADKLYSENIDLVLTRIIKMGATNL